MALNPEEMNRRRERREAQRKQQEKERRRLKLTLIAACVVLALCGFAIFSIARGASQARANVSAELSAVPETTAPTIQAQTEAATESRNTPTNTVIHLRAAGDLNVTNAIVQSGLSVNGYDFTDAIMDVAAELSCGDVTVLNLEGNICGEPYGTISASAPRELAAALRNAGVDLVQLANSYTVNNGIIGLNQTLQQLRSAGIEPMGAYANDQDYRSAKGYTICNIQGIRVAFVAFTKGLGGMGLPAGNENCVNLLYEDYDSTYKTVDTKKITTILDNVAEEKPDLVVAMLHWGSENSENITASQEKIISLMQKMGVDVYSFNFNVLPETQAKTSFSHTFVNDRTTAKIHIYKVDKESGKAVAQGDASLEDALTLAKDNGIRKAGTIIKEKTVIHQFESGSSLQ